VGSTVSVSKTTLDSSSFVLYDKTASTTGGTGASATSLAAIATASSITGTTDDNGYLVVVSATPAKKGFMDTEYDIQTNLAGNASKIKTTVATMDITAAAVDTKIIAAYMKIVDATSQQLLTGASVLGSMSTLLKSQQDFTQQLMDINTSSIGSLVDANIEEESTKLKALQTQQQLGVQALSIANSSSQNVLSLFR
jgi:flagellin